MPASASGGGGIESQSNAVASAVKSTATPTPRDQLRNRLTSSIGTGKSRKGMLGSFELFLKSLPQLTYYERVEKWTKISASSEASADNTVDVDLGDRSDAASLSPGRRARVCQSECG